MSRGTMQQRFVVGLLVVVAAGCTELIGASEPIEVFGSGSTRPDAASDAAEGAAEDSSDGAVVPPADGTLAAEAGPCSLCPPRANASVTCPGTQCDYTCDPGFHMCGSECASDSDPTRCGSTCTSCFPNGTLNGLAVCEPDSGQCAVQCEFTMWPTWCPPMPICTNLQNDPQNCGTCGHVCPGNNPQCIGGTCG